MGVFQNIEGTYLGSDLVQYANARGFVVPFPISQVAFSDVLISSGRRATRRFKTASWQFLIQPRPDAAQSACSLLIDFKHLQVY